MTSIADGSVKIQTTPESNLSTPSWFGEVVLLIGYLRKHGVLSKISEQVRFARKRFGRYEVIDFLAVLFGYAISGERTRLFRASGAARWLAMISSMNRSTRRQNLVEGYSDADRSLFLVFPA
jgi:hypothetical protein